MSEKLSDYCLEDFTVLASTAKSYKLAGQVTNGSDFKREWEFFIPRSLVGPDDYIPQWILDKELEKAETYFGDKAQILEPAE